MGDQFWLAVITFFLMVSSGTILWAVREVCRYIRLLQSMIADARKLGLRTPPSNSSDSHQFRKVLPKG